MPRNYKITFIMLSTSSKLLFHNEPVFILVENILYEIVLVGIYLGEIILVVNINTKIVNSRNILIESLRWNIFR